MTAPTELFANDFTTQLAAPVGVGDRSIAVVSAAPSALQGSGEFRILVDGGTASAEIMVASDVGSGTTWSVARGSETNESPTPTVVAHVVGAPVLQVLTEGGLEQALADAGSTEAVTTETTRAEAAEAADEAAVASETTRAEGAESTETSRAETAESSKASSAALTTETSRAEAAEGANATAVGTESTRAEAEEATKAASSALTAETTRAEGAEEALIPSSSLGQASGPAKLGTDGTVGGPSGSPLSSSVANATGVATGKVPVTNGSSFSYNSAGVIDTVDAPQPLGTPNPGTGVNGAAAVDHVHQMPSSSQLSDSQGTLANGQAWVYNSTAGKMEPATILANQPIWFGASNGQITLPRLHVDDSGSYTQTPGTEVLHLTYFVATAAQSVGHIKFGTGGTAAAGNTLTQVGLFSVNAGTGALTLVANSASPGTALGSYANESLALTASYTLTAGATYAVGILQVGTTSASLLGHWVNDEYLGELPVLCQTKSSVATMPSTVTSGLGATGFAVFYFLTT